MASKCIIDGFAGSPHPYNYCVKPSSEMVKSSDMKGHGNLSMDNVGKVLNGMFGYVDYLTLDADRGTAKECKTNEGVGLIGNRYVLKTNIKCQAVDNEGKTIAGDHYLHKYINNVADGASFLSGGRPIPDANGLIPATLGSATKIGGNVMDLMTSFSGETKPYCMKAQVKCHLIDNNVKSDSYKGDSPEAHFSLEDLRNIPEEFFKDDKKPTIPTITQGFNNIDNTINENIINHNLDKIQNYSDSDSDNLLNSFNFEDELLVKTYYIGFSLLMMLIIFKLLHK